MIRERDIRKETGTIQSLIETVWAKIRDRKRKDGTVFPTGQVG